LEKPWRTSASCSAVYDLERRVLLWVGDDRTEEAVKPFFTREMGARRVLKPAGSDDFCAVKQRCGRSARTRACSTGRLTGSLET
jgi:hypothetical protein